MKNNFSASNVLYSETGGTLPETAKTNNQTIIGERSYFNRI